MNGFDWVIVGLITVDVWEDKDKGTGDASKVRDEVVLI